MLVMAEDQRRVVLRRFSIRMKFLVTMFLTYQNSLNLFPPLKHIWIKNSIWFSPPLQIQLLSYVCWYITWNISLLRKKNTHSDWHRSFAVVSFSTTKKPIHLWSDSFLRKCNMGIIWIIIIGKRFQNIQSITIFCIGKLFPKANLGNLKRLTPFATKK